MGWFGLAVEVRWCSVPGWSGVVRQLSFVEFVRVCLGKAVEFC